MLPVHLMWMSSLMLKKVNFHHIITHCSGGKKVRVGFQCRNISSTNTTDQAFAKIQKDCEQFQLDSKTLQHFLIYVSPKLSNRHTLSGLGGKPNAWVSNGGTWLPGHWLDYVRHQK